MKKSSLKKASRKPFITIGNTLLNKALVGIVSLLVAAMIITGLMTGYMKYTNSQRLDRIQSIYASLKLDDSYREARSDIFGDKRVYDWDKGRTWSSSIEYGKNSSRSETFNDLKKRITAAGFKQIPGPNYGEVARQDHYKSDKNEYIRVSVDTSAVYDGILYGTDWPSPQTKDATENAPVYVTIKVNLDDNNE